MRSLAKPALHPDTPAHHLYQPPGDAEAKPCASKLPCGRRICLVERLENHFQFFRRDPHARVGNQKMQDRGLVFYLVDRPLKLNLSFCGELESVADEIKQHLAKPP